MRAARWTLPALVLLPMVAAVVWLLVAIGRESEPALDEPLPRAMVADAARPTADPEPLQRSLAGTLDTAARDGLRVTGRVVDVHGEPVRDAAVGDATADRPTRTAADGRFAFAAASGGGTLTLLVLANGHAPLLAQLDASSAAGALDAGDLQLLPGGGIRGQITGAAGNGLVGATVAVRPLTRSAWPAPVDLDALFPPTTTDAQGRFAFAHLQPGGYEIAASARRAQTARAGAVTVREGLETTLEPIVLAAGHDLAGVVLGRGDLPLAAATVRVRSSSSSQPRFDGQTETGADGRFALDSLPPGPLQVEVARAGFLRYRRSDVDASRGEELVVRLEPGLGITGTVADAATGRPVVRFAASVHRIGEADPTASGAPDGTIAQQLARRLDALRGAAASATEAQAREQSLRIAAELEARLTRLQQTRAARPVSMPREMGPLTEWPEGRFAFDGLEEGLYAVAIAAAEHPVAQQEPIEVRRGLPAPELRFVLAPGQVLAGIVVTRRERTAVAGASVELVRVLNSIAEPAAPERSLYPWIFARKSPKGVTVLATRTDAEGRFELRQATPGSYHVAVRHPHMADHETEVFELRGGRRELRIEVGARASLSGRVGGASSAAAVEVFVLGGHGTMRTVRAGADGSYRVDELQPGSYLVRAFPAGASQHVQRLLGSIFPLHAGAIDPDKIPVPDVTLHEGEARVLDVALDLPRAGSVQGAVSIQGRPATGARAILRPVPGEAQGSGDLAMRADCDAGGRFALSDVPAGKYTLVLQGPTRQELASQPLAVTPGATTLVQQDLAAGGLRGRVWTRDATPEQELLGTLWVLPGATEEPQDLYEHRRTRRTHRIPVRKGAFADDALTPGPAIVVLDLRGRKRVATRATVPAGGVLTLDLTAGELEKR